MRNLRLLVIAFGVAVGSFYPFIAVILVERGFNAIGVGIVGALGALSFTIAVPAWGHLADVRLGGRGPWSSVRSVQPPSCSPSTSRCP